ncbi:MAG: hypothetical protein NC453_27875 [Muribaculum sp.]|nr:hypothetical protein [Muribaculum sp.]
MKLFDLFKGVKKADMVIDGITLPIQRNKLEQKIGSVKQYPTIRILYPRGKNRGDICVADLFCLILWDVLEENNIEVHIDRGNNKSYRSILNDIKRNDCYIVIIITCDGISETKHEYFYHELIECNRVITDNIKSKEWFIPILLCEPENINVEGVTLFNKLVKYNKLDRIEDFAGLSLNKGLKLLKRDMFESISPCLCYEKLV